jgi:hypothetical protein
MPGAFLVEGGRVHWRYRPDHAGDHPDEQIIASILRKSEL